jgi:hypothetical protein
MDLLGRVGLPNLTTTGEAAPAAGLVDKPGEKL